MTNALRSFMVALATDPDRLRAFMDDPDGAMAEAGLGLVEREVLLSGDQQRLFEAVAFRPDELQEGEGDRCSMSA